MQSERVNHMCKVLQLKNTTHIQLERRAEWLELGKVAAHLSNLRGRIVLFRDGTIDFRLGRHARRYLLKQLI